MAKLLDKYSLCIFSCVYISPSCRDFLGNFVIHAVAIILPYMALFRPFWDSSGPAFRPQIHPLPPSSSPLKSPSDALCSRHSVRIRRISIFNFILSKISGISFPTFVAAFPMPANKPDFGAKNNWIRKFALKLEYQHRE